MRRWLLAMAAFVLMAGCEGSVPEQADRGPAPVHSVVQVLGDVCRREAQGSGVIIGADLVLTTAHTVAGAVGGLQVRRPSQDAVAARLVGFDPDRDLAVLHAPGIQGESATFGVADPDTTGLIGTMNVDGQLELLEYTVEKLVTANSGDIYDEGEVVRSALQLVAETLPGDSGGALFDSANRVVGIVFAQSRGEAPVAYAVTAQEVEAFLSEVDTSTEAASGRCR